jgi:hypothetical protein
MLQSALSSNNEANDQASTLFRGNADVSLYNSALITPNNECIRLNGSGATPVTLTARSVVLSCNATKFLGTGTITAAQTATAFGAGANNNRDTFTSTLTSVFVNGANESGVPATDVSGLGAFFTATNYIGGVRDANDTWYAGWTCNSAAANFGTTSGSCFSLPTN